MDNFVLPVRKGGLGNQMFQVAAAIVYQEEKGKVVLLPKEYYNHHNKQERDYADTIFSRFSHRVDIAFDENVIQSFLRQSFTKHSTSPGFDAWTPEDISGNVLLHGYFQYYPVLEKHETLIREIYLEGLQSFLTFQPSNNLVGIHVRRGDYLKPPHCEFMPSQPISYYERAVEYFDIKEKTFCIFSDDLDWCKEQSVFCNLPNKVFIDEPDECKTLAMMTICHGGFICANSTFSWWGAFLGAHTKREPVFVPVQWFKGEHLQLFPKEWVHL